MEVFAMARKRNLRVVLAVVLALLASITAGCSKKKESEVIKIGAILPLTGVQADHGGDIKNAINMLMADSKQPVKVIYEDSQSSVNGAVNAARKLITSDGVTVLLGPITTGEVLAVAPICESKKRVLITPTASSPEISDAGDYIFRTGPLSSDQGIFAADYAREKLRVQRVAILYMQDDTGIAYREAFRRRFEELGGKVVYESGYSRNETDFRTEIAKIKAESPELLYVPSTSQAMGYIARQTRETGLEARLLSNFGIEGDALISTAGDAANGVMYTAISVSPDFLLDFEKEFGKRPGIGAPLATDAMAMILELVAHGSKKADDFKEGLYGFKAFPGVCGKISMDASGDGHRNVIMKTVRKGEFTEMEADD
jgi:branched-chain amino acid transport system substrate-binding protein